MNRLAEAIVGLLRRTSSGRRTNVCIVCRAYPAIAARIAGEGHPTVVIGDRFRPLLHAHQRACRLDATRTLAIESTLSALPIQRRTLDFLVLLPGLPVIGTPLETLVGLRELLADGGLLVWPHLAPDGLSGWIGRSLLPAHGTAIMRRRVDLTGLAMEAGFREVGQLIVPNRASSWILTTGCSGPRRWDP